MITLDTYKKEGFSINWPWHPDPTVRYACINAVKRTAGFSWSKKDKAWICEGPEVLLDLDRIELWKHITTITPAAQQRAAKFRIELEGILEAKHKEHAGEYGFQINGTEALVLQKRGLLADDMGLGKSKQTLDAIAKLGSTKVLVVAPKTLTYNWAAEIEKWYPNWEARVMGDTKKEREEHWYWADNEDRGPIVSIVNYEKIRGADWDAKYKWDVIVYDETQKLKNTNTQLHKAARKLKADYVWGLSGTPMEIRVEELYGIMSILRPSVFGGWMRFRDQHIVTDAWGTVIGQRNTELLKERLAPWMTRRKKSDVLKQLPPKLYNTVYVELSKPEQAQYKRIKTEFLDWLKDHDSMGQQANVLVQLLRLQQFTDSYALLEEDAQSYGAKYEALVEILKEYDGRVMIFTRFEKMQLLLTGGLGTHLGQNTCYPQAFISGPVGAQERLVRVNAFNAGQLGQVLVSTDAGAYGLNVTGADLIIHYDQLWNPGKMWQREDRLHRIGQTQAVSVLTLIVSDTIDEGMAKVLEKRRELFTDIIDGAEDKAITKLGVGALRRLVEGRL